VSLNQDAVLNLIFIRYQRGQVRFDFVRIDIGCQAEAIGYTRDMSLNADCGLSKCISKENVCGFAAHAREREQIFKLIRNPAAKVFDEGLGAILNGRGLLPEESICIS
jgi:hypothetical protein